MSAVAAPDAKVDARGAISLVRLVVLGGPAFTSLCVGIIDEKSCAEDTCADHKNKICRHGVSFRRDQDSEMCPFLSVVMLFCAAFSSLGVGVIGESSGGKETRANRKHEICRH